MIKNFHVLYVGQIELDNIGLAGTPANLEISRPGAENILAQFPGGSQKAEDYIDTSLIDALRAEGYFNAMAQKYKR